MFDRVLNTAQPKGKPQWKSKTETATEGVFEKTILKILRFLWIL